MIKKFDEFINESLAYMCGVCGERAEHEEIEENPNMKCSNCGHSEWEIEHDDYDGDYINEEYEIVPDDYKYFKRQITSRYHDSKEHLINDLIENRNEWIKSLFITARSHWELGSGNRENFPDKEYFKVINDVIDEIINER